MPAFGKSCCDSDPYNPAMLRRFAIVLGVVAALLCPTGCAVSPPASPESGNSAIALGANSPAEAARRRLTNTNNGLELRRWTIVDAPGRAMHAIVKHARGPALDEQAHRHLKRNGFRLIRVALDDVEALLADLGGATVDANEWHGQVHEWRPILQSSIDSRGRAFAIDGQVERYDRGEFRLMMRSWSMPMEYGPTVHLELLPVHFQPRANDLRRLLDEKSQGAGGASRGSSVAFESLRVDLQLESQWIYLLVSESPEIDWPEMDANAAATASNAETRTLINGSKPGGRMSFGDGPDAPAPQTLGETLLPVDRDPPLRSIVVFIPRIAPELFPDSSSQTTAGKGP
jgi:hypothetical protein